MATSWKFYRSQFWRLQKLGMTKSASISSFIGHNFGDYKNYVKYIGKDDTVLSVTILETTKTQLGYFFNTRQFYRSQFWRLQKPI